MKICSVDGCGNRLYSKNKCRLHWFGENKKPKFELILNEFKSNSLLVSSCWEWDGSLICGYGRVKYKGKLQLAHRLSWEYFNSKIPQGLFVLHHCDNRKCFNFAHLFLGTNQDNMTDMVIKRRHVSWCKGKNNKSCSKLTNEDIPKIRDLINKGLTNVAIAKLFNIGHVAIHNIRYNHTWKHIPHDINKIIKSTRSWYFKGDKHHFSKLKEPEVIEIKKMISSGMKNTEIAILFNVTHGNISSIRTRKTWKCVQ